MKLVLLLLSFCYCVLAKNRCDERSVTLYYKKPIYEFSTDFLDRVSQDTDGHFVSSPISAWLQLMNLAEGARGVTLKQISRVTGRHGKPCMRRTLRKIMNNINGDLENNFKSQSVVVVDKLLGINKTFKRKLQQSNTVKVMPLDFDKLNVDYCAKKVNGIIKKVTGISNIVEPYDFVNTSILLADAAKFKSAWRQPFNPVYTTREKFYVGGMRMGQVKMMSQLGYFNYTKVKAIHAEILELPCVDENHSMLIFLPTKGTIKDIYFYLKRIRLATIFNLFKKSKHRLINVRLPRFKINSELMNLPVLINDMGISYIFNPTLANFKGVSEFPIEVNDIRQVLDIEVTEEGVSADVAQSIIDPEAKVYNFVANKPFAFMLVDKATEIILFGGVYSIPEVF